MALLPILRYPDPRLHKKAKPVAEVVAMVTADKPKAKEILVEARASVESLRLFVIDKQIISVPRQEIAEVRQSPPFMRGNFAGLGGAGPFESTPQPSFYYISPPDPSWPDAEQKAYIMSRPDLLFVTAHEVWPGHFVQGMHQRASGSRMLQTFETYTTSEGWAHYVERLLKLPGIGARYRRPVLPDPVDRSHFGLPENRCLFLCPQSLFKIHPDNDELFARVLAANPRAALVLFDGRHPRVTSRFIERLTRVFDRHGVSVLMLTPHIDDPTSFDFKRIEGDCSQAYEAFKDQLQNAKIAMALGSS